MELDSIAVIKVFSPQYCVHWLIWNGWINYINLVSKWNFVVSHTFREYNSCADILVNLGLSFTDTSQFSYIPLCIMVDFVKNRFGLPFFRFVRSWENFDLISPILLYHLFFLIYYLIKKNYLLKSKTNTIVC